MKTANENRRQFAPNHIHAPQTARGLGPYQLTLLEEPPKNIQWRYAVIFLM